MESALRLIDCVYESVSICYGIIAYTKENKEDAEILVKDLLQREYPAIFIDESTDLFSLMLRYRLFAVRIDKLPGVIRSLGPAYMDVNIIIVVGQGGVEMLRDVTRGLPCGRQIIVGV